MIDFHSHILPELDDGSESVEMSLAMLREARRQGITTIFATPHFYADETNPRGFLRQREESYNILKSAMDQYPQKYPDIQLGAEVLFFPGMSVAEELQELRMGKTRLLLIEPPMMPWTNAMLDEIEQTGINLRCIPVLAHVDRYMAYLQDETLMDQLRGRRMLVQFNAGAFLDRARRSSALGYLAANRIQFLGSDCHNVDSRPQNLAHAARVIEEAGFAGSLERLERHVEELLDYYRE